MTSVLQKRPHSSTEDTNNELTTTTTLSLTDAPPIKRIKQDSDSIVKESAKSLTIVVDESTSAVPPPTSKNVNNDDGNNNTNNNDKLFKLFCPPLKFEKHTAKPRDRATFNVNVIQDGVLPGGTKQRALYVLLTAPERAQFKEFVYASPTTGFAQVALSHCCKIIGKQATIFTAGTIVSSMSHKAKSYGGKTVGVAGDLATTQAKADAYVREDPTRRSLIPFGVESEEFRSALVANIRRALPTDFVAPRRVWLAVGSGTLLRALGVIWPQTEFMAVRVGKNVWEDQFDSDLWRRIGGRARIDQLRAVDDNKLSKEHGFKYYSFSQSTLILPPYSSVSCYDAKVWERLLRYGEEGDFVWNVAAD